MTCKNKNAAGGNQTAVKCNFCKCMIVLTDIQDFILRQIREDWSRAENFKEFLKRHKDKPYSHRDLYLAILELNDLKQILIEPEPDMYCRISDHATLDAN